MLESPANGLGVMIAFRTSGNGNFGSKDEIVDQGNELERGR